MASLANQVLDAALTYISTNDNAIHICSSEPTTYSGVAGVTLGNATMTIGAPADRSGGGRQITLTPATGASVTGTGTATHYGIVDSDNSILLAAGALTSSQAVTSGNTFDLGAFTIAIPDPA